MEKSLKINFFQYLFYAIFGLSLYFLFYLPLELLLTDFFFVLPKVNSWINTGLLLFFLLIANLFDLRGVIRDRKKIITLLFLVVVSLIFYNVYYQIKLDREYLPKIYQVKPSWVIQGQPIEIKGTNLGMVFQKGEVMVDGMEFLVKDWSENRVIVEAPVPSRVGNFNIFIKTKDGRTSNFLHLEIKDPNELLKYLR